MLPPIARRFAAGTTESEALDHARDCNERGLGAIVNLLGGHYENPESVVADREADLGLIDGIAAQDLHACISVNATQLGLNVDESRFREELSTIISRGIGRDVLVWIDMEDYTTTDAALDAYEAEVSEHGGSVGVCVQANLRRAMERKENAMFALRAILGR